MSNLNSGRESEMRVKIRNDQLHNCLHLNLQNCTLLSYIKPQSFPISSLNWTVI